MLQILLRLCVCVCVSYQPLFTLNCTRKHGKAKCCCVGACLLERTKLIRAESDVTVTSLLVDGSALLQCILASLLVNDWMDGWINGRTDWWVESSEWLYRWNGEYKEFAELRQICLTWKVLRLLRLDLLERFLVPIWNRYCIYYIDYTCWLDKLCESISKHSFGVITYSLPTNTVSCPEIHYTGCP